MLSFLREILAFILVGAGIFLLFLLIAPVMGELIRATVHLMTGLLFGF